MDHLREYIRDLIADGNCTTDAFQEGDSEVWEQAADMAEDLNVDVSGRQLKFFGRHLDGSVVGGAWVSINEGKFEFVITLDEDAPDAMYEDLVRDCLDEFDYQNGDEELMLEVSVDNDEDRLLFERMGMSVLREYVDATIMGIDD